MTDTTTAEELEEEFANRYSPDDNLYNLALTKEDHIPPVLTNWTDQGQNRNSYQRDRRRYDGNNDRGRERYDGNNDRGRDRYEDRSWEDRGRYGRDRRYDDRNDGDGYSNKRPRNDDSYRGGYRSYR